MSSFGSKLFTTRYLRAAQIAIGVVLIGFVFWLFYARLNMTKAQSISILFIVAGIILLFERRYVWLWPIAFLYVWTYNLFVILGVLSLIWVVVVWWSERRIEWRPLLWTSLGMV